MLTPLLPHPQRPPPTTPRHPPISAPKMSERTLLTLDDAGLFLPSDMFPDVLNHRSLSAAAAAVPRRLPPDDLTYVRPTALSPDVELARHLAATLALRRPTAKLRREPHSFFEFGPDVLSPTPAPAPAPPLCSPRAAGEVFCRGCLGILERAERHVDVDVDPWYRLQLPARPLCAQGEEGGFPVTARIQAQKATTGQAGGNVSRDYGGTGVFLPRVANNNGDQRKTGMQGDTTREKEKPQQYQPPRGLPSRKQAVTNQPPSGRGLPQDWSYY